MSIGSIYFSLDNVRNLEYYVITKYVMAEIAKPLANKVKYLSTLLGVVASLLTFNPQGALGTESGPVEKLILGTQSQQVHPDEIALQNQLKEFGLSTTWAVFSSDFI